MLCCCIRMLDVSSLLLLWVVFDTCARSAPAVRPQCARSAKFGPYNCKGHPVGSLPMPALFVYGSLVRLCAVVSFSFVFIGTMPESLCGCGAYVGVYGAKRGHLKSDRHGEGKMAKNHM